MASWSSIPKERPLLETSVPTSGRWRKLYDCRRTKGQHAWVVSNTYHGRSDWRNSELRSNGWFVEIRAGKRTKSRWSRFWWSSKTYHPNDLMKIVLGEDEEIMWERNRDIHCSACGKPAYESEQSPNGVDWTPDEWTIKNRKKHGTA